MFQTTQLPNALVQENAGAIHVLHVPLWLRHHSQTTRPYGLTKAEFIWRCGAHDAFCGSLTPVSAHFLDQESIPRDYLHQATRVTLGVMLNFNAAQQNAERKEFAAALYMKPPQTSSVLFLILSKNLKI